jgi:hypothetical protein
VQVERRVRIKDESRVELIQGDGAERNLERCRRRVDAGEGQRLPAHEFLRGRTIERIEIADRQVAGIACPRAFGAGGCVDHPSLGGDGAAGDDDVRLRLEIRPQRHQIDAVRIDAQIGVDRVGCECATDV